MNELEKGTEELDSKWLRAQIDGELRTGRGLLAERSDNVR